MRDIDDGFARGKPQLSLTLKPEARSLGINATDLARQVRSAFYGAEALRQQRGRNEVRVMVRLPEEERRTAHTVEHLMLRTAQGGEIPLFQAAAVERGHAYTEIRRREGRRTIAVTADVDESTSNANTIIAEVLSRELPALMQKYPGLNYVLEGEQASQQESLEALGIGFLFALLGIYGLLAVVFRSYCQPLIVMLSIPFGIIGAILGHLLLGYGLSIISMFGIIALAGVVINDSLVLVVTANTMRMTQQLSASEAISLAGARRFRPIFADLADDVFRVDADDFRDLAPGEVSGSHGHFSGLWDFVCDHDYPGALARLVSDTGRSPTYFTRGCGPCADNRPRRYIRRDGPTCRTGTPRHLGTPGKTG